VLGQKNQLWWDLPAQESFLLLRHIYGLPTEQFQTTLDELENAFRFNDAVLRHLVIKMKAAQTEPSVMMKQVERDEARKASAEVSVDDTE
jgi:small subunit ribosomal protein S6